jgi:hypothetical protein
LYNKIKLRFTKVLSFLTTVSFDTSNEIISL